MAAASMTFLTNPILWIGLTFLFMILFIILFIVLILIGKKTHAIIEFKAWMRGIPIAMFFLENRYVEWKPVKPDAGIITDKNYGAFIVNEKATYVDRKTKNVIIPFDAQFGAGVNMHAAKLADDLQYIINDEEQLKQFRMMISQNLIQDNKTVDVLKTSINMGALKTMMTALMPHNINSKIEKVIASRMKGMGQINIPQVALLFAAVFGAIVLGALILKFTIGK
jgi:hypothetical protein